MTNMKCKGLRIAPKSRSRSLISEPRVLRHVLLQWVMIREGIKTVVHSKLASSPRK